MTKEAYELYQKLKNLNNKGIGRIEIVPVLSVDTHTNTCSVLLDKDEDGNDIIVSDVRLKATMNSNNGFIIYPAINSNVLIERIDDGYFAIRMVSEIDSVAIVVNDKKYMLDENGHYIGNADNTLLSVINLIIDATMETIVFQGRNPNYEKLTQAKTMVQQILQ